MWVSVYDALPTPPLPLLWRGIVGAEVSHMRDLGDGLCWKGNCTMRTDRTVSFLSNVHYPLMFRGIGVQRRRLSYITWTDCSFLIRSSNRAYSFSICIVWSMVLNVGQTHAIEFPKRIESICEQLRRRTSGLFQSRKSRVHLAHQKYVSWCFDILLMHMGGGLCSRYTLVSCFSLCEVSF